MKWYLLEDKQPKDKDICVIKYQDVYYIDSYIKSRGVFGVLFCTEVNRNECYWTKLKDPLDKKPVLKRLKPLKKKKVVDKQIKKIEKQTGKVEKSLKSLEKADKKRDKIVSKAKKVLKKKR